MEKSENVIAIVIISIIVLSAVFFVKVFKKEKESFQIPKGSMVVKEETYDQMVSNVKRYRDLLKRIYFDDSKSRNLIRNDCITSCEKRCFLDCLDGIKCDTPLEYYETHKKAEEEPFEITPHFPKEIFDDVR